MYTHKSKSEVAALVEEFGVFRHVVLTVDDAQDVAEFFAWYVRSKLGLSDSLQLTTVHSSICICDTLRESRETADGYCVAAAGMIPTSSGDEYDFGASIVPILIQEDPENTADISEPCPNRKCFAQ